MHQCHDVATDTLGDTFPENIIATRVSMGRVEVQDTPKPMVRLRVR